MFSLKLSYFIGCLGLLAGATACGSSDSPDPGKAPAQRPDIVLALIDTWRWDALGANVGSKVTPELDALAATGVRFTRAFSSAPWTLPSVASTLTGHLPSVHGAHGRDKDAAGIRDGVATLAEFARDAGYRTVGVTCAPFLSPTFGFDRGFETYAHMTKTQTVPPAGEIVERALELVAAGADGHDDRPLFLLIHVFDPHMPLDPPEPWDTLWTDGYAGPRETPFNPRRAMFAGTFDPSDEDFAYMRALYDGEVSYVSHEYGRFFERFAELRGPRERLIALTADHGEEFKDHGGWEHGHAMYSELVQIPLVVVPPASWSISPKVVDAQVRLIDLFPTFLEAIETEMPAGMPGVSLGPLMRGDTDADRPAFSEQTRLGRPQLSYRDGKHALIVHLDDESVELYDQVEDPAEQIDLSEALAGVVEALRRASAEFLSRQPVDSQPGLDANLETNEALQEQLRSLGYMDDVDSDE